MTGPGVEDWQSPNGSGISGLGAHPLLPPPIRAQSSVFVRRLRLFIQLLWVAALVGAFGGLVVALVTGATDGLLIAGGCAALAVVAIPFVVRRDIEPFEPMAYAVFTVFMGVTLRTFYLVFVDDPNAAAYSLLYRSEAFLVSPMIIVILGLGAMTAGYMLPRSGVRLPIHRFDRGRPWPRWRFVVVVAGLGAISVIGGFLFFRQLGIDLQSFATLDTLSLKRRLDVGGTQLASLAYFRWLTMGVSTAFYVALARVATSEGRTSIPMKLAVLFLGLMSVIFPFLVSSRSSVLRVMVYAAMIWHCLRRQISVKALTIFGVVAVSIFASMGALRAFAQKGDSSRIEGLTQLAVVGGSVIVDRHFLDITKTGHIIDAVPNQIGWAYGSTLVTWVVAPIPRSLWPGKPIIRPGLKLGSEVFGNPEGRGAVPPGAVAEFYMNFGVMGVLIGMFVLGAGLRVAYLSFRPYLRSSKAAVLLYMFIGFDFTRFILDTEVAAATVGLAQSWVMMGGVLLFMAGKSRPSGTAPAQGLSLAGRRPHVVSGSLSE
jgi:oligosaccharide repeat unit polymerase